MVIYHHSMVMLLFHVIKHYFHGYYCRMAVNYHNMFITLVPNILFNNILEIYHGIFNPRKSRYPNKS